jgi:molecular chaperone HtpG
MSETFAFQAEINQLMSLIINAFYSNKDIFLRELISNSSDALDKIRYENLTNKKYDEELCIKLKIDRENRVFYIIDTGIGMTKEDLINNLGTIARSGTKSFMEQLSEGKGDLNLIGQFGVGFYSAFLVADNVQVTSKSCASDTAYTWESNAGGTFTITESEFEYTHGTVIKLSLKEDQLDYLETKKIEEIVKKHSGYVGYPISLLKSVAKEVEEVEKEETPEKEGEEVEKEETPEKEGEEVEKEETPEKEGEEVEKEETPEKEGEEVEKEETPEKEGEEVEKEETPEKEGEEVEKEETPEKVKKTVYEDIWVLLNSQKPVWTRKSDEVTTDEYKQFYKNLTNDWDGYQSYKHFNVEGQLEFTGLLYIPKHAPYDMFEKQKKQNLKLYVRRVFISDECEDLIPEYLSFVKGIVDSEDLPLNVSREILQQNKVLKVIRKNVVKKCLEMFEELEGEDFKQFYNNFSKNLKLGIHEDGQNRGKLVELLRFDTLDKEFMSLKEYTENMQDEQKSIYFITGESRKAIENSPFLEILKNKKYNVLFLTDAIDEYAMQQLKDYKEYKFVNVTKEGLDFDTIEETEKEEYKKVCEYIKNILGNGVEKVVLSNRIKESPCVLVTSEYGWSANMERIMKAQALGNNQNMAFMGGRKTLEINKDHNIIKNIKNRIDENDKTTEDLVKLMYESALLASGFSLEDPQQFNKRIIRMIQLGLSLDNDEIDELEKVKQEIDDTMKDEIDSSMEEVD